MVSKLILGFLLFNFIPNINCLEAIPAGEFPSLRFDARAIYDGQNSIYILGGASEETKTVYDDIFRYDLNTEKLDLIGKLPTPRYAGVVGSDGFSLYFLGGFDKFDAHSISNIAKFTLSDSNSTDIGHLPLELAYATGGIHYDGKIYTVGGQRRLVSRDEVIVYDPVSNEATIEAHIGEVLFGSSSVWIENSIYTFGGWVNIFATTNKIHKYTPETDEISVQGTIPELVAWHSAVTDGKFVYLVGSWGGFSIERQILKIDAKTFEAEQLDVTNLPKQLLGTTSVYIPKLNRIYSFGGKTFDTEPVPQIFYIQL